MTFLILIILKLLENDKCPNALEADKWQKLLENYIFNVCVCMIGRTS